MRISRDLPLEEELSAKLAVFEQNTQLLGVADQANRETFVKQLVDSIRRINYVTFIRDKVNSPICIDPTINGGFNPIKAAAFHSASGNFEEACWMVFILTHFSKNKFSGWRLVQDVYGQLGNNILDWQQAVQDPPALGIWIDEHQLTLKERGGNFGNHRKYQSLHNRHTGRTISSYIEWVGPNHSHGVKFAQLEPEQNDSHLRFRNFYRSMGSIYGFGRTAIFDYLTMIGKLQLAAIEPDSVYMTGATGPFSGGQLLFTGNLFGHLSRGQLNQMLSELNDHLAIPFGMQVLEDALCNWQKNPSEYVYFNG
jgi:hypothetical protein